MVDVDRNATGESALDYGHRVLGWYVRHAKIARRLHFLIELLLIGVAAAIPIAGLITPGDSRLAAILGAVVVGLTGVRALFHFRDNWVRYSLARTEILTEMRLFEGGVGTYGDPDAREALFIEKLNSVELVETSAWATLKSSSSAQPSPTQ